MQIKLNWTSNHSLFVLWFSWIFFVLQVPGWQVTSLLPMIAGLQHDLETFFELALVSLCLPIVLVIFTKRQNVKAFTLFRRLLPWLALGCGVLELILLGQLVILQGGAVSPAMLPVLFILNPCMAGMIYLILQEASIIAVRINPDKKIGRNLYVIMAAATGLAALADMGTSQASLYWAPAGLSIQAVLFLGLAALFFLFMPLEGMSDETMTEELDVSRDTTKERAGHSILGFIGGFGACAAIMSISSFFSYFSSGYWYFAPDSAMVAVSYPTTTLFAKPLIDLGLLLSMIVSTVLGIAWPRFTHFKSTSYSLLLCGTCISFIAFIIHESSGSWYANLSIYTSSLIVLGIGAGMLVNGALYLARDEASRPFGMYLIAVILPFAWHIATTLPSAHGAASTNDVMIWLYILEGAAVIFLACAIIAWRLYKDWKPPVPAGTIVIPSRIRPRKTRAVMAAILIAVLAGTSFVAQFAMSGSPILPASTTIQVNGERGIGKPFGVNCHLSYLRDFTDFWVDDSTDAALLTYIGCNWIRSDFWWASLFPNATGTVDHTFLSYLDKFMSNTSSYGLKVQALLSYGQPWACPADSYREDWQNGQPTYSTYPTNITNWTNYIGFVANRYKNNASMGSYEIYNEPNNERYWCVNSSLFANLTVEAAMTIKAVDMDAVVLGPGLSQTGLNDPRMPDTGHANPKFLVDWINDADAIARGAGYSNGFGSLFDGVCLHPYGTWGYQAANYQALAAYMDQQATRFGKPFKIDNSETGYNTAEADSQPGVQAQDIAKSMITSQMLGVNTFIVYEYRDASILPANYTSADRGFLNGEDFYGIVDLHRVPKESYYAFGTIANLLNDGAVLTPWGEGLANPASAFPAQGMIVTSAFRTNTNSTAIVLWRDGTGNDSTSITLHFAEIPASSPAAVTIFNPNTHSDRSWGSSTLSGTNVQINNTTLTINDIPVGQNMTIVEIKNQSSLQSYTISLPTSFGLVILAPAILLGLVVAVIVVTLPGKPKKE